MILLIDELENIDGYLACVYCGSRNMTAEDPHDTVRECMKERSYTRVNGVVKQTRFDT